MWRIGVHIGIGHLLLLHPLLHAHRHLVHHHVLTVHLGLHRWLGLEYRLLESNSTPLEYINVPWIPHLVQNDVEVEFVQAFLLKEVLHFKDIHSHLLSLIENFLL